MAVNSIDMMFCITPSNRQHFQIIAIFLPQNHKCICTELKTGVMAEAWATPDLLQQEEGDVHDVTDEIEQATESMKVIKSRILSVFNKKRKSTEKKQKGQNSKPPSGRKATAADSVAKESVNKLLDLYNGWEDNLQCAICLSQFKDPLALTCLHSFCSRCLEMILINTKGTRASSSKYISCPTCRRPTYLGKGGGLERLVKNWYIDDIYEKVCLSL